MKKLVLAAAFAGVAGSAFAAGFEPIEPVMEPVVIEEETQASTYGGVIIPLVLIALVAAAMSGDD